MEVEIELGHKALKNLKPTFEGYTHDWTIFVQGANGNDIKHFVKKVVFCLPNSYQDPIRIREEPPFAVSESTSSSITIEIDVYFSPESKPKKVHYIYDMHISDEVVNISWMKMLAFPNPSKEFKEKLLLAGGKLVDLKIPIIQQEMPNCKVRMDNEMKTLNGVDGSSTTDPKFDNSQNSSSADDVGLLRLKEMVEENQSVKKSNADIERKIDLQKVLVSFYERQISQGEKEILDTNKSIEQYRKKIENDEKEVSALRSLLVLMQNEQARIRNAQPENFAENNRVAIARPENPAENNREAIARPENPAENNREAIRNEDVPIRENRETVNQSLKDNSEQSENCILPQHKNESSGSHGNVPSADAIVLKSTNAYDVEKSVEGNSAKGCAYQNTKDIEKDVYKKSIETSSPLVIPEIIIIDDDEESIKSNIVEGNDFQNKSKISMGAENCQEPPSVNKFSSTNPSCTEYPKHRRKRRLNRGKKIVEGNNLKAFSAAGTELSINKTQEHFNAVENPNVHNLNIKNNAVVKIAEERYITASNPQSSKPNSTNKPLEKFDSVGQKNSVNSVAKSSLKYAKSNSRDCPKSSNGSGIFSSANSSHTGCPKSRKRKRRQRKGVKFVAGNTIKLSNSASTEPCLNETQEQSNTLQKHNDSSLERTKTESSKFNCESQFKNGVLQNKRKEYKHEKLCLISNKESQQGINDTSDPKFISFMTEHCQILQAELNRIKSSEFSKYREGTNSLFYKLKNIDSDPLTDECCKRYLELLTDYFVNPKMFDKATLIYVIIDYLYHDRVQLEDLPTYIFNGDLLVILPPSENCIASALYTVDNLSLPHLNGLIRSTLEIIHQVIISKKNMDINGLSSLCRVFTEICRRSNDKWEVLFLCCELLRLEHPLAPYLINSLAASWREPFKLYDKFSVEGNIVLGAIMYGMKEKPLQMKYNLWKRIQQLRLAYFPHPFIMDYNEATEFITAKIVSRCLEGLFENLWMLASPLVIFVSKGNRDQKLQFKNGYILPNLLHFSNVCNEHAFGLFCNLYVDIFSFSHGNVYQDIRQYFHYSSPHQGIQFVQDCAAIALLKYFGITDKSIPEPLRNWFLRNQGNPKLSVVVDLYCKKVMESHNSFLLWDDVIIL